MVFKFSNSDGQCITAVGAHFRHEHNKRKQKWLKVLEHSHKIQGHTFSLTDDNSLIVPASDTAVPAEEKKLEILAARDTEVSSL